MRDLKGLGARNASGGRPRGLTGRHKLSEVERAYERFRRDGVLPATYEVVYGHAWAPTIKSRPQDGSTVASFPLNQLRRRPKVSEPDTAEDR
jgi:malonyl-CoA O-methyltransferase